MITIQMVLRLPDELMSLILRVSSHVGLSNKTNISLLNPHKNISSKHTASTENALRIQWP